MWLQCHWDRAALWQSSCKLWKGCPPVLPWQSSIFADSSARPALPQPQNWHKCQHCPYWCWSMFSALPLIDLVHWWCRPWQELNVPIQCPSGIMQRREPCKSLWQGLSFFLYFREITNKRSHWPGGQSAPRLYNSYNLCSCARPAHVGECWPGPEFKFTKLRFTTLLARDRHWRNPRK